MNVLSTETTPASHIALTHSSHSFVPDVKSIKTTLQLTITAKDTAKSDVLPAVNVINNTLQYFVKANTSKTISWKYNTATNVNVSEESSYSREMTQPEVTNLIQNWTTSDVLISLEGTNSTHTPIDFTKTLLKKFNVK